MRLLTVLSQRVWLGAIFLIATFSSNVYAGGGYFSIGYGHVAKQTAGAVTALSLIHI